jgi:hypothetical protein
MVVAAALTPNAIVTETHSLISSADALRSGFVKHLGETVERYRHGFDDPGKIEYRIICDILFRGIIEGRGDHRHILDPLF